MTPLIEVTNLKAYYYQRSGFFGQTEVRAVDGVTLRIDSGETLAVVGESGSGKTTLGRAILNLMKPVAGTILFGGEDVSAMRGRRAKAFRRRVQAISQDPYSSISPFMSVHEIVEEPLIIHGVESRGSRKRLIEHDLERVKLTPAAEMAEKYPHALSGGQRQRVSIARAMILNPELIIADEPVSMVDASNRAEILSLLRELQKKSGVAFLYITHDIANARHFSDRITVMYAGTVVETGPTIEVIDNPLHPYTRALLAAVPDPDPENRHRLREVIPGDPPSGSAIPTGCPFHTRCPEYRVGICDDVRPLLMQTSARSYAGAHGSGGQQAAGTPDGAVGVSKDHEVACVLYEDARTIGRADTTLRD